MNLSDQFKTNVAKIINNEWLSDKETQMTMIHLETEMEILRHKIDQSVTEYSRQDKVIGDVFDSLNNLLTLNKI